MSRQLPHQLRICVFHSVEIYFEQLNFQILLHDLFLTKHSCKDFWSSVYPLIRYVVWELYLLNYASLACDTVHSIITHQQGSPRSDRENSKAAEIKKKI